MYNILHLTSIHFSKELSFEETTLNERTYPDICMEGTNINGAGLVTDQINPGVEPVKEGTQDEARPKKGNSDQRP
jgi:hypothetical protein